MRFVSGLVLIETRDVDFQGQSGLHLLGVSISASDQSGHAVGVSESYKTHTKCFTALAFTACLTLKDN